jgi:hypothetical protein
MLFRRGNRKKLTVIPWSGARRRFADVAVIQERVTAVLWSILKEAFADSFQKFYERYQQCVVKDGEYFEGQ